MCLGSNVVSGRCPGKAEHIKCCPFSAQFHASLGRVALELTTCDTGCGACRYKKGVAVDCQMAVQNGATWQCTEANYVLVKYTGGIPVSTATNPATSVATTVATVTQPPAATAPTAPTIITATRKPVAATSITTATTTAITATTARTRAATIAYPTTVTTVTTSITTVTKSTTTAPTTSSVSSSTTTAPTTTTTAAHTATFTATFTATAATKATVSPTTITVTKATIPASTTSPTTAAVPGETNPATGIIKPAHGATLMANASHPGAAGSLVTTTRPIDAEETGSDDNEDRGSMMGVIVGVVVLVVFCVVAGVALIWRHHWRKSKDAVLRRHTLKRSQHQQHTATHVNNPGFQPDGVLPTAPGYVEDGSIQVNQGRVEYAVPLTTDPTYATSVDDARYGAPLTTATTDPTYSQPLDLETGSAHYAASPLTTADDATGSAHYAATPLTTADEEMSSAGFGASLTTAGSIYSVPLDAHNAKDSQA